VSSAPRVPPNANSTRSTHFRGLIGSGSTVVIVAVLASIAFVIGASQHNAPIMGGGPVAILIVTAVVCWFIADNQAENEFFGLFARANGMNHFAKYDMPGFTPLLAAGDRRHCEHWMESKGRAIGWYTFEVKNENGDNKDTYDSHDFTLATVDVGEMGMARFQGIYLRRRRGIFERLDSDANWLGKKQLEKVELESTKFMEKYELYRDRDQDEIKLRQLFAPTFVVWLSDHPLAPGFELRAGQLVVFITGHCSEAGKLQFLLMAANEISKRIQAELTQAAQAGSL
jgi:hypothetical protein